MAAGRGASVSGAAGGLADDAGPAIGAYAAAVLDHPLPWTKMRQVYALLGLVGKWGPARVEAACRRALDAEAISVALIGRMLQRGTESQPLPHTPPLPLPGLPAPRFARDALTPSQTLNLQALSSCPPRAAKITGRHSLGRYPHTAAALQQPRCR